MNSHASNSIASFAENYENVLKQKQKSRNTWTWIKTTHLEWMVNGEKKAARINHSVECNFLFLFLVWVCVCVCAHERVFLNSKTNYITTCVFHCDFPYMLFTSVSMQFCSPFRSKGRKREKYYELKKLHWSFSSRWFFFYFEAHIFQWTWTFSNVTHILVN